nr:MAG TPA: hypothetical protein [Caudoviricetes sp.]
MMTNADYLCYLIYMFADYMFSDATIVSDTIDIYNEDSEVILSIHVYSGNPDSVTFIRGNGKGVVEAVTVMNVLISFIRMIHVKHSHPFHVINRLVSVSE